MRSLVANIRWTLRLRLTLLYGVCFLIAGAAVLGITYGLVAGEINSQGTALAVRATQVKFPGAIAGAKVLAAFGPGGVPALTAQGPVTATPSPVGKVGGPLPPNVAFDYVSRLRSSSQQQLDQLARRANLNLAIQRTNSLSTLLAWSAIALALMAVLSVGLGWLMAGRALRPLRAMSQRAREITEESLHERLGLDARDDELGELAQTFNELLARLERAFESQRRFVANASHELRTPLTLERALVEVALSDPNASVASLRRTCERVLAAGTQQERVIEALLTLARGQAGIVAVEAVDLAGLAAAALAGRDLGAGGVAIDAVLEPAVLDGDPALLERLVANLVDNAMTHNVAGGWVRITTGTENGHAVLRVANGGPVVPRGAVEQLFEPFRRLEGERMAGDSDGLGLGLSIVRAIAVAHAGAVAAVAPETGGLEFTAVFEAVSLPCYEREFGEIPGALPEVAVGAQVAVRPDSVLRRV